MQRVSKGSRNVRLCLNVCAMHVRVLFCDAKEDIEMPRQAYDENLTHTNTDSLTRLLDVDQKDEKEERGGREKREKTKTNTFN